MWFSVLQMSALDLSRVSPNLLNAQGLSLAVPGTYRVDGTCVKIHKFLRTLQVRTDGFLFLSFPS